MTALDADASGLAAPGTDVLVVGTGLIGTSAGLALTRAGWQVHLDDVDGRSLRLAGDLGAGLVGRPRDDPCVVLVCTPPMMTAEVIHDLQGIYLKSTFSDVASVKTYVEREVASLGVDSVRFVGGHPMAGRERSGARAAQADLFDGRPWVLSPGSRTSAHALADVRRMVEACGAVPVVLRASEHDRAVALVSHLPQLLASAMAAQLVDADEAAMALAGQGLRDLTRIAESDPALWAEILGSNADGVLAALDAVVDDLGVVQDELRRVVRAADDGDGAARVVTAESLERQVDKAVRLPATIDLIARGRAGRARLPGKHGAARVDFSTVQVVVPDRPGELARLLVASGEAGVNVEDVTIEHSPGQPVGLVELAVRPDAVTVLADALEFGGWSVHV